VGSYCWRHWKPGQKLGRRDMITTSLCNICTIVH
jgi:hypothetical protein